MSSRPSPATRAPTSVKRMCAEISPLEALGDQPHAKSVAVTIRIARVRGRSVGGQRSSWTIMSSATVAARTGTGSWSAATSTP